MADRKCAFITGAAARGIGYATAKKFLDEGWGVVMFDVNKANADQRMSELTDAQRSNAEFMIGDVTKAEDIQKVVDHCVEKYGHLDAVYNGAGVLGTLTPANETDFTEARRVIDIDLMGSLQVNVIAGNQMVKQGSGAIVNTASIAGQLAGSGPIAYSVAKAGVEMLTKFMAKDLSRYGVRFVTIAPGWVETDIDRETLKLPGMRDMAEKLHCSKRIMQPEETAEVIYFLCTPAAKVINGSTVNVDDGFSGFKEGEVILV